jgi:hypothetical protein
MTVGASSIGALRREALGRPWRQKARLHGVTGSGAYAIPGVTIRSESLQQRAGGGRGISKDMDWIVDRVRQTQPAATSGVKRSRCPHGLVAAGGLHGAAGGI